MKQAVADYLQSLGDAAGEAWNRFWFTPSSAAALGRVRAAVGALTFFAIATYGPDVQRWFGDGGMLPLDMVRELYTDQWSLLDYVGPTGLWALYVAGMIAALALTLGIGGRIAAVAALVFALSFFHRAPMLTGKFEAVLAFLLAYLCVGEASDSFSLRTRFRGDDAGRPHVSNTVALRLIQIHVALVHAMMALAMFAAKDGIWFSGEGLWLAAAKPGGALVDVAWLKEYAKPVALASHFVTAYFSLMPIFAWQRLTRPLVLAAAVIVWPLLAATTGAVPFCLAMAAGMLAFWEQPGRDAGYAQASKA